MTYDTAFPSAASRDVEQSELETWPHSIEAEQAFLGALLYENEIWHEVSGFLRADHFHDPVHGRIYDAAAGLIGRGALCDAVVLKLQFERDGGLSEIGGAKYLAFLLETACDDAAAVEYARLITATARRRCVIRIMQRGIESARDREGWDTSGPAAEPVIEGIESELFALSSENGDRGYIGFADALRQSTSMTAAAYQNKGLSGLSTGLKAMDQKLGGLHASDLIILAGRPSMGKTALAVNIAHAAARALKADRDAALERRQKAGAEAAAAPVPEAGIGFFSLEMSAEQLATRIVSERARVSSSAMRRGTLNPLEFEAVQDAAQELAELPLYIDETGGLDIATLCARARRMTRLHGLKLIVVDYLQLCTSRRHGRDSNRTQEVSEITSALKALAKELKIPVLALSQLSRQVENREDKKPQLSDLRESGSIEQDADVVLFVYREAYYKEREEPTPAGSAEHAIWTEEFRKVEHLAEIIVGKQRHGPIGTIRLGFDGRYTVFSDLEDRYEP